MKTAKKMLAVLLAMMLMLSTLAAGASAAARTNPIHRVDITLNTNIAGKPFWDYNYDEIYSVDSEHAGYPSQDVNGTPARAFAEDGNFADEMVAGRYYHIEVYVQADESWYFADDVEVYINGEKSEKQVQPFSNGASLYIDCGTLKVQNNESISLLQRIVNAIKGCFDFLNRITNLIRGFFS